MNRIIVLLIILFAGLNQTSYSQCNSAGNFGFLTSAQNICGADVFSRRIYIEDDGSGTWTGATLIQVEVDWGDGTVPFLYTIPYNGVFNAWTDLVAHTAPDGAAHTNCTYEATAILYVDGVDCSDISQLGNGGIQTLNVVIYDEIDNPNLGVHDTELSPNTATGGMNGDEIEVCQGDTQDVVVMDNSDFNCSNAEPVLANRNDTRRWIQFVYGTGATNITGSVLINGVAEALPFFGDVQLVPFGAPVATNLDALPINFPVSAIENEVFEVVLRSWNVCNPYDDNLGDGDELNPVAGTFPVGNVFPDAAEAPIVTVPQIIRIIKKPDSPTPNPLTLCQNSTAATTLSVAPAAGATDIIWYDADPTAGFANVLQNSGAASYATGVSTAVANQYSYWVTQINAGDNACESDPVEVILTIREALTVDAIVFDTDPGATEVCTGATGIVFSVPNPPAVEGFGGATEYEWEIDNGVGIGIVGAINGQSITVDIVDGTVGTQTIRLWRRYTGAPMCEVFSEYDIEIFPKTVPGLLSGGTDICEGEITPSLELNTYTGSILRWERSFNGGLFADIGNVGSDTFSETLNTAGSYEYQVVVQSGGGCLALTSTSTIVNVFVVPPVPTAGGDDDLCGVLTHSLSASSAGIYTGQWSVITNPSGNAPVFSATNSETSDVTISAGDEGIYEFEWTVTNGPCSTSDVVQVIFREAPTAPLPGANDAVCGTTYAMSGNTITVGVGTWSVTGFPPGGGLTIDSPNDPLTDISLNMPFTYGTYTLQWEAVNGVAACNAINSVDITFSQGAEANAGTNLEFCMDAGAPANINLSGTVGGISTSGRWEVVTGNGVLQSSGAANGSTIAGIAPFALNDVYITDPTDVATIVALRLRADSPIPACPDEYSNIMVTINEEIGVDASTNGTFNTPTEICQSAGSLATFAIYGSLSGGRIGSTGVASLSGHWEVVAGAGTILNGASINGTVINDGYTPGLADLGTTVTLQLVGEDPDGIDVCGQIVDQIDIFINEAIVADATKDGVNVTPATTCVNSSLTPFDVYGLLTGGVLGATSTAVHSGHWEVISGNGVMNSSAAITGNTISAITIVDQYVPDATDLGTTITLRLVADDPDALGPCGGDFDEINIEINEEPIPDASTNGVDFTPSVVCVNPTVLATFSVHGSVLGGRLGNSGVAVRSGHWEVATGGGTMTSTNTAIGSSVTGSIINDAYRPVAGDLGTNIELHLIAEDNDTGAGPCSAITSVALIEINELLVADAMGDGVNTTPLAQCIDAANITSFNVYGGIAGGRIGADGSFSLNGHWEVVPGFGSGTFTSSGTNIGATISGTNSIVDAYLPDATDIGNTIRLQLVGEDPDGVAGPCTSDISTINIQINEEGFVTSNQALIQIAEGTTVVGGFGIDELGVVLSGSGASGQWSVVSVPNEGVISNVNSLTPNFTPSVNQEIIGSVTLQFDMDDTDGVGPCTAKSTQVIISIAQNPTVDAGTLNDICEDEVFNLNGTIGGSATSATWSVAGGAGTLSFSNVAGNTVTASYIPDPTDTGNTLTFTLTTNDPDGTGPVLSISEAITATIHPLPVITGIDGDLEACAGNASHPYFVQGANPALSTFNWDLSSLGTLGVDYTITAGGAPLHFVILKYLTPQLNRSITVTETTIATGCDATFNLSGIDIYETPYVTLESSDADLIICTGEEVTFTAVANTGVDATTNYEFILDGLTVQNGLANTFVTTTLVSGNALSVKVSNGDGLCAKTKGPIVHIVNDRPIANDQSIVDCSDVPGAINSTVNLTLLESAIDGGLGSTIVWYNDASETPPAITNVTNYTVTSGDVLYAVVDGGGGCTYMAQVDYIIHPTPGISAAVTSDYNGFGVSCFNANDGQITATLTENGIAPYVYSINDGITFQASNVFDNLVAGTYKIIIKDDSNCSFTTPINVVSDPLPLSAGLITGGGVICANDPMQLISELSPAFGGIGNYSYQWQISSDNLNWNDVTNANAIDYLPEESLLSLNTFFRRKMVSGLCSEQFSNVVELKLNPLPTGTFDFLSIDGGTIIAEVCENQPFLIQFQFTGSEPFFFDYSNGSTNFQNQFGASTMLIPVTGGISEDFTIDLTKVRGLNNCEALLNVSKTIKVIKINASLTASPDVSCNGADVTFTFNVDQDVEYTLNFGDGSFQTISPNSLPLGENTIVHQYMNGSPSTTFTFNPFLVAEKTIGMHCGPIQEFETIIIYPAVLPNVYTPKSEICSGELISFDNQTLGASSHEWFYRRQGVDEQIELKTTREASFTIVNEGTNNPQVYEIVYRGYTDNNDGNICESTQIIPLNVYKYADPNFSFTPANPVIANGATSIQITNLTNPLDEANFQYDWEFGDGITVKDQVNPSDVSYSQAGNKEVRLTVINRMYASCSNTYIATIPIQDIPISADFNISPASGCAPLDFEIANNTLGSADKFSWTIYKQNSEVVYESVALSEPGAPAPVSFSFTFYDAGFYSIQLVAENTFTGQKDVMYKENAMEVYPIPTAAFDLRPSIIYLPDQTLQTFNYTDLDEANTWFWDFGDGIGTSQEYEPEYVYTETGNYSVTLVAGFDYGAGVLCTDTLSYEVIVEEGGVTKVPNAFTPSLYGPSTDGTIRNETDNDIFLPITEGVLSDGFHMLIFDRWGNLLFESKDKNVGWDGYAHDGKALPAGVYVYKLSLTLKTGRREEILGDVILIK